MTDYALTEESLERIQEEFIEDYDTEYWHFTLNANYAIWKDSEEFVDFLGVDSDDPDWDGFVRDVEQYATSEIVYTFYHTAEALFAMMMASQTDVPWLILREYRGSDLWEFAREIVGSDETNPDTISSIFYPTVEPDDKLDASSREIHKYIQGMFQKFEDNETYNSYKHGLRLMTDEEYARFFDGESDEVTAEIGGYAHIYLEDEDIEGTDMKRLIRVVRAYDAEYYNRMALLNVKLIEALLDTLERKKEPDGEHEVRLYDEDTISNASYERSDVYMELQKPYDVGGYTVKVE